MRTVALVVPSEAAHAAGPSIGHRDQSHAVPGTEHSPAVVSAPCCFMSAHSGVVAALGVLAVRNRFMLDVLVS